MRGFTDQQQEIKTAVDTAVERLALIEVQLSDSSTCQSTGNVISQNITALRTDMPEARALSSLASRASNAPAASP